ncbi:MAG TPA: cyanophycinase [Candidatus Thermoplasmatota archaeon]|nr:cyanophycinase [Candidatus Thermoplasmatota archaeon]
MTVPRGILVAVGGAEDKKDDMVVLRRVIDEVKGEAERVEVIAGASREPREAAAPYLRAFEEMGIKQVDWMAMDGKREADAKETVERLRKADVIYFTGGDQVRLSETLRGSKALDVIRERYEQGAVVAGTSAGAAAMSEVMLARGTVEGGLNKGNVSTDGGLGLMPHTIIDTHFVQRGRFARLMEAVAHEPELTGIGISEDTAIIVREGHKLEVVGSDNVIIFDGTEVLHTNADEADRGEALIVARVVVHALAAGCHYDLETRELRVPKVDTIALRQDGGRTPTRRRPERPTAERKERAREEDPEEADEAEGGEKVAERRRAK